MKNALMRRIVPYFAVLLIALAIGFGAGYWFSNSVDGSRSQLPVIGQAPAYTLTNQLGQPVRSSEFAGKVRVETFLFPYCTDYCPLIAAHLVGLERALQTAGFANRVQLIAFNVDPAHTGPKVMAAFMRQYGWNPQNTRWQYLTGTPDLVRQVVTGGFHVDYERVPEAVADAQARKAEQQGLYTPPPEVSNALAAKARPDYDVTHNDSLILVDPQGRIRRVYPEADRVTDQALVADIRSLLPSR